MASYTIERVGHCNPLALEEYGPEAGTIRAVRIGIYLIAFAAVIGFAAAIAWLSIIVAPVESKQRGLTMLAIALGGLAVAGGVVYLAEKLIYLAKEVAFMVARYIVEKYEKHRYEAGMEAGMKAGMEVGMEAGMEAGRDEERQYWQAWYERQQAALRDGRPFDEPPPGYSSQPADNGKEPD